MVPFLIAGAAIGLGSHIIASANNNEAKNKNQRANEVIEESNRIAQNAKKICQDSIDNLAKEKTIVLQGTMRRFVKSFSKINPVNFEETGNLFENAKFNKNELVAMQTMVNSVQKVSVNDVVGGVSGTALAIGAADMLAGGTLLGGAGISVGGLAGGAALGAIAAPVFAITGIFSASEAAANLEKANSNLTKALAYKEECEVYSELATSVSERCDLFYDTLHMVNNTWFLDAVSQLEALVNSKRSFRNFIKNIKGEKIYTKQEMAMVASVAALAKMIKTIIDTNILDEEGHVTEESGQVIYAIQDEFQSGSPLIKYVKNNLDLQNNQIQLQNGKIQQDKTSNEFMQQDYQQISEQQLEKLCQQPQNHQILEKNNKQKQYKSEYCPNAVVSIIMWAATVFFGLCGVLLIFGGEFIAGVFWIAAGLMMCKKVNVTMTFWPRFGLMFLLLAIGSFLL